MDLHGNFFSVNFNTIELNALMPLVRCAKMLVRPKVP